jgi:hypothetical protein
MSDASLTCKAERLAVAATVAPSLRGLRPARRIALVDADGHVTGYTTSKDVAAKLLERANIEIAVDDGVRPAAVVCVCCGRMISVRQGHGGTVPTRCSSCPNGRCLDCAKPLGQFGATRCTDCYHLRRSERLARACRRGHERTADNTRIRPDGSRECRLCSRARKEAAAK